MTRYAKAWVGHPSKLGFHLNKHYTTISFHLRKLQDMDIIESTQNGTEIKFRIKKPEEIYNPIITYEKSLLGDANNRILKWINHNLDLPEIMIEKLFEILPHPYYG